VPRFNGQTFSHKPPFMYWAMMVGYQLFGVNEFSARFGSAVFGIFSTLLTYRIGRRLFCAEIGLYGGLIMCGCLMFALLSRAATPDGYLTFFFTLALYLFTLSFRESSENEVDANPRAASIDLAMHSPSWPLWIAIYTAMGLAVLVK